MAKRRDDVEAVRSELAAAKLELRRMQKLIARCCDETPVERELERVTAELNAYKAAGVVHMPCMNFNCDGEVAVVPQPRLCPECAVAEASRQMRVA